MADYNDAIQLDPAFAPAYFNIGALLGNCSALREALLYFEKAAQLGLPQGVQHAEQVRERLKKEESQE